MACTRAVSLEGAHPEVHVAARIPDVDLGRIVGGAVVDREVAGEAGEERRLFPGVLAQHAVDHHAVAVEARDGGGGLVPSPVVHALLRRDRERNGEERPERAHRDTNREGAGAQIILRSWTSGRRSPTSR